VLGHLSGLQFFLQRDDQEIVEPVHTSAHARHSAGLETCREGKVERSVLHHLPVYLMHEIEGTLADIAGFRAQVCFTPYKAEALPAH
jgi:hypothetical protein